MFFLVMFQNHVQYILNHVILKAAIILTEYPQNVGIGFIWKIIVIIDLDQDYVVLPRNIKLCIDY